MTTVAATPIRPGIRLTLAEFLALPEMEQRCELIDGVLHMAAFPIPDHEFLSLLLGTYLNQQILFAGAGIVLGPTGLLLAENTLVGPDIIIIRAHRTGIVGPALIHDAPDIVVEVLSTNRHHDLARKRALYQAAGIPEYWLVDGDANTLAVLGLGNDGIYRESATLTAADTLTTPLFPDFTLPLAQLFNHPARPRR